MIKIIFCDMDGTLLTSQNKLPEGFDEMMAELKNRNVIFAPASGRQFFSLIRSFEKYRWYARHVQGRRNFQQSFGCRGG